jgi:hypothetical protein
MKVNKSSLFWGILLIGLGAYALAESMGYKISQEPATWALIFGGVALLSLVFYLLDGFKAWGWLFPVGIFSALAFLLAMVANDADNAAMVAPLFFGIGLPFVVAYFLDRSRNWWALIPAGVMLFFGFMMLIADNGHDEWIGALFLFMIALSFFIVYLNNRTKNWWALIPAGVMLFLALIVVLSTSVQGEWIGALFLFAIALSFFVVYLNNRTRQWALLVAYILFVLSIAPAMASFGGNVPAYFGTIFLLAVALPFFVVYFRSADDWWAIIPAGVMTTLAVVATLGIAGWIKDTQTGGISNAILMGGLAVTFAVIWLRHAKPWAKVVSIVLALLAVASAFFASYNEIFLPIVIILAGAYLLYTSMRKRPSNDPPQQG